MNEIRHKRGTTFSYAGQVRLPAGTWSAACKLRNGDALVETLTAALSPLTAPGANGETHALLLEASASATADWPLAKLQGDIVFSSAGAAVATGTFYVIVHKSQTQEPQP